MTTSCAAKIALLFRYSEVARKYSDAVIGLHERVDKVSKDEADRLYLAVEDQRASAEHVRLVLERHLQQHGS